METLIVVPAVAVVALVACFTGIIRINRHEMRHLQVICRGRRTRRGILQALADGIMIR